MIVTKVANLIKKQYLICNGNNNIIFYFHMYISYNPHQIACRISCLCLPSFLHNFFRSLVHAVLNYKTHPSHTDLFTSAKLHCSFNHRSCFPKALDTLTLSNNNTPAYSSSTVITIKKHTLAQGRY